MDIDDESRGETAECPSCQAELKIPLVRAPQVRVPVIVEAPAEPRPVQKKKLVITQETANTLAAAGKRRPASKAGIVVGVLVGLVIGVIIGACLPFRVLDMLSGKASVPTSLSVLRPTKVEWKSKLMQHYALQNNRIFVPATETNEPPASEKYTLKVFQQKLGQPDKCEKAGDNQALAYICSDGQVQVLISATNFESGQVIGALIKED